MTGQAAADHHKAGDLVREMETLKAEAAATGGASRTLQRYAGHFTMLAYRTKDGTAEIHRRFADMFFVVHGKATLVSDGTLMEAHEESPGEERGRRVEGGTRAVLGPGDVVNIPAGTPHQLLIAPGDELLYFVVKVTEPV